MTDDIRPTNQIIYAVDIYDASHALLVTPTGRLKVDATLSSGSVDIGLVDQGVGGSSPWLVTVGNVLIPAAFDYVALSPTGTNPTTIVYKTGGAGGTTVATLTLTYDGNNNVQTVTRS